MSRKKLWILKRKKFLIFSFFCFFIINCFSFSTFPPSPEEKKLSSLAFESAKQDFARGNLNSAYKNLLLSSSLKEDEGWRKLYFLTLLGLNEPLSAISFLQEQKKVTEGEKFCIETLLKRQGVELESPRFSESLRFSIPKEIIKKASFITENQGNIILLSENSLYKVDFSGKVLETRILTGGKELLIDKNGNVVVLTKDSIITKDAKIVLPLQINAPISFARAPEGNFYVLDESNELFLVSEEGRIIQQRQLFIKKCLKVRTDDVYRVYILSSNGEVSVYNSDFSPLTVLDGKPSTTGLNGIKDFFVDYAGNPIFLDKSGELFFFNFKHTFLGKTQKEKIRTDLFFWDGGKSVISVDKRKMVLRKLEL
ncbi:MAG: hypothetical protein N2445_02850 [Acidobacteria bacterium]|nr:hypothetical protein [Acidobacteriota bacterium]